MAAAVEAELGVVSFQVNAVIVNLLYWIGHLQHACRDKFIIKAFGICISISSTPLHSPINIWRDRGLDRAWYHRRTMTRFVRD